MTVLNLFRSYNTHVDRAYIITIANHATSEMLSQRAQQSCAKAGMPYQVWDAFDGTGDDIKTPAHSAHSNLMPILKITDHYLTRGEVACVLSHVSLWHHCAVIDQPIVILEHDAVMVRPLQYHESYNSIVYLGGSEWTAKGWPMYDIPPHASEGPNCHFICRAHAYSIDPAMAKNLLAHIIKMGICAPVDIMIRADLFHITHNGLYAYDDPIEETTILARPSQGRSTTRNDDLKV
ncbi:Glycosyl transferase, family 25 [uncultured Caudovirales phage]|uniref:Glycosyl transferase, family 25 n=1 Tax=uncultured Caudovirales phage TaxID=2100421 RepID=A0A6J5KL96_9CAUD|nr:Glycosyl transferase, family 25 [uncultured Caudovirales phage]